MSQQLVIETLSARIEILAAEAHKDPGEARADFYALAEALGVSTKKSNPKAVGQKLIKSFKEVPVEMLVESLHQLPGHLQALLGVEISVETVELTEDGSEQSVELPDEVKAVDESNKDLDHAVANAAATIDHIEEAIDVEPDPTKREERRVEEALNEPATVTYPLTFQVGDHKVTIESADKARIEICGRRVDITRSMWRDYTNVKEAELKDIESFGVVSITNFLIWNTKRLQMEILIARTVGSHGLIKNLRQQVAGKLGKSHKDTQRFIAEEDKARQAISQGRYNEAKPSLDVLFRLSVEAKLRDPNVVQKLYQDWGITPPEGLFKSPKKPINTPVPAFCTGGFTGAGNNQPAQQPADKKETPVANTQQKPVINTSTETPTSQADLPLELVKGLVLSLDPKIQRQIVRLSFMEFFQSLSDGRSKREAVKVLKTSLDKIEAGDTSGYSDLWDALKSDGLKKWADPGFKRIQGLATDTEAMKKFIEDLIPKAVKVIEENRGQPKGVRIETKSQRDARLASNQQNTPPVSPTGTTAPATAPAPQPPQGQKGDDVSTTTTQTTAVNLHWGFNNVNMNVPTQAHWEAIAKDAKALATMGPKTPKKELTWTIAGTVRSWFKRLDCRMLLNYGPLPDAKGFGKLASDLKDACEGEEKALISPKGKGEMCETFIAAMNVLVEAGAMAKTRFFTAKVNGKEVHIPTRIGEVESLLAQAKNGQKDALLVELKKLTDIRDSMATKWGIEGNEATASMMKEEIASYGPEIRAILARDIQALGNYALGRNLPENERFVIKGFKPEVSIERVKELAQPYTSKEGFVVSDEVAKAIKAHVESITSDKEYTKLLNDMAVVRTQLVRLLSEEKQEQRQIEQLQQRSMQLGLVGGIVDGMRVGTTAAEAKGWSMAKDNAPVWTRDHDILVKLIAEAKDGEHNLPGCGEDKRETVGKLAASILVTFAYSVHTEDGGDLISYEWQRILDGIRNVKALEEQVRKPGFRGYGRQVVWGLYVGTRWVLITATGIINWALSPVKGVYYALKALGLYGVGFFSKKGEEYKAAAKEAIEQSGQSFLDIVRKPWNAIKGFFVSEKKGESVAPDTNTTTQGKESTMKSTFVQDLGLSGITSYSWGDDNNKKWDDQSTGQKVLTVTTLPFRAVKRIVVAQPAISVGTVTGAVAGGLVGTMVLGTVGIATVGAVVGGAVVGGLVGWGVKALLNRTKTEQKDTVTVGKGKSQATLDVSAYRSAAMAPQAPVAATVSASA